MAAIRSRSRGIRPVRQAWLSALVLALGLTLVIAGVADMRRTGRSGSPYLLVGLFPALLAPIGLAYYASQIAVVRHMRRGTTAMARWTLSPSEFQQFLEADARVEAATRTGNFYRPPAAIPAEGLDVIVAAHGVLIGDGYFPLSATGGRRVRHVRLIASQPPMIEFGLLLATRARTSGVTSDVVRSADTLRIPVAGNAELVAHDLVSQYERLIASR